MASREPGPRAPTDDSRSLRANFVALTGGRLLAALAQWVALIVVAKATDVETVGQFALAQVICIPIAEIARMGLREVRATDVAREYAFRHYFALRIIVAAVAFAVMVAIGGVAADSTTVFVVVLLYAASRVVELLSDIVYGLFQLQERLDFIGRSLAIVAPVSIALLTFGLLVTDSLIGAVVGQLVGYLLVFVFHDLVVAARRIGFEAGDRVRPEFDREALRPLLRISVPLALASVLAIVAIETPRVLVAGQLGTDLLGIFAPLYLLAMAPSRLVHSLGTAATTPLATRYADGDRRGFVALLTKLSIGAVLLGGAGIVVAASMGEWIVETVYTAEYRDHADLFVLLVAAGALRFVAELLGYGVIASRRFWWLTAEKAAVAAVAVVAGLLLVHRGLDEAGAAVAIVHAVQLATIAAALAVSLPRATTGS